MEVRFNPELQAKLSNLAAQQGRDSEALVVEAVERLVNYDAWFLREVDKGLAAADRGEFVDHEDVGKLINSRYPANAVAVDGTGGPRSHPNLRLHRRTPESSHGSTGGAVDF